MGFNGLLTEDWFLCDEKDVNKWESHILMVSCKEEGKYIVYFALTELSDV
jgi:hypothetical protein